MTAAPLPIGTRVRIIEDTEEHPDKTGRIHSNAGNGYFVAFDNGHAPWFYAPGEIVPNHARPYDPATEHAKIVSGNTMGIGKHVDLQHYGTLPKHSKRYDMRLDGVRALLAN